MKGRGVGVYTKCAHVRTRGRKVKKIGHNLHMHVLNGWMTQVQLLKLLNTQYSIASKLFLVNIEQCSLLGLFLGLFLQIQLSLFNMRNICVVRSPLLDTHYKFACFIFLLFKDFSIVFSLFVNCKQTNIFFDCRLIFCNWMP